MIKVKDVVEEFNLKILNNIDVTKISVDVSSINRLALQLTGYFEYFDSKRIQIIGKVEHSYIDKMDTEFKYKIFDELFSKKIPALILCRGLEPQKEILEMANKYNVPILNTTSSTKKFKSNLDRWLKIEFAPKTTKHGVLVDIFGEGVLIIGESGIGKSETALELIKRGHRIVADDAVEIKRIENDYLVGSSPEIIRYFMELRGIGIIDIREMFGVESVKESQVINLVIDIQSWDKNKKYDRLGIKQEHYEILGVDVPCNVIPIRPGRNLAMICEVATINMRQKKMGYNAAEILNNKITEKISKEI